MTQDKVNQIMSSARYYMVDGRYFIDLPDLYSYDLWHASCTTWEGLDTYLSHQVCTSFGSDEQMWRTIRARAAQFFSNLNT